jgi:hypothetical protein
MFEKVICVVAIVAGGLGCGLMLMSDGPLPVKAFIGALAFVVIGAYYLFTGKKAASVKEFIVDGKAERSEETPKL